MDKYFLAANSKYGFFSKFNELTSFKEIENFYIIKGTAGSGKSTFMKKLGNYLLDKGFDAEFIYCSSDPDSLDGVISKGAKLSICDGTAPHITEPKYPGAYDYYLDFSRFLDLDYLKEHFETIKDLTDTISSKFSSAYAYLECAGTLDNELFSKAISLDTINKVKDIAKIETLDLIPKIDGPKKHYDRFITGYSPKGLYQFYDTLIEKEPTIYNITDSFGLCHFFICEILKNTDGYTVYKMLNPLNPHKIDHIYIEELNLAFVSNCDFDCCHNINLDYYVDIDKNYLSSIKSQIDFNIKEACDIITVCKSLHDDLEEFYKHAMNYDALDEYFDFIVSKIK